MSPNHLRLGHFACLTLSCTVVFFPTYLFGETPIPGQRILYLLFPLFMALIALVTTNQDDHRGPKVHWIALALLVVACFHLLSSVTKLQYADSHTLATHSRYIAYAAVFAASYHIARNLRVTPTTLATTINLVFIAIVAFVLGQFLIPEWMTATRISNRGLFHSELGIQIGGPFVWSYSLAFFLLLVACMNLSRIALGQRRIVSTICFVLAVTLIIASQSKAAYLAMASTLLINSIVHGITVRLAGMVRVLAATLAILALGAFALILNIEHLGNLARFLDALGSGSIDASTQTRLNQLQLVGQSLERNPIFGAPKAPLVIENAYGHYLYHFGMVGLFTYLALLGLLCIQSLVIATRSVRASNDAELAPLAFGFFGYTVSAFVFSLGSAPIDGHKTAYLFWLLFGMLVAANKTSRQRDSAPRVLSRKKAN